MENHDENTDEQALESARPRANQMMRRDFGGMSLSVDNAATQALVAKARADVESRWLIAMRRPRNLDDVRQDMIKECKRPGFAEVAIYSVPRGGTMITGLSIRFAEVAARCMGNLPIEVQTIYDSPTDRTVRVTVTDLESNVTWSRDITVSKTIERKNLKKGQRPISERVNSYGDRVYIVEASDDDVNVKEGAAVSKAARTGILRLIPGHLQDEAMALCKAISADRDAKDPNASRNRMADAFGELGIMPSDLEQWLGHPMAQIAAVEAANLKRIHVAICEGETTWADALEAAAKRKTAPASTPASATPTPQTAPTAQATKPQAAPATEPAKSTGGKGAAALKNAIGGKTEALDKATEEARARDAARADALEAAAKNAPPDEHPCPDCGVPCTPPGKCTACAAS